MAGRAISPMVTSEAPTTPVAAANNAQDGNGADTKAAAHAAPQKVHGLEQPLGHPGFSMKTPMNKNKGTARSV